jgi:hypothetical protein
MNAGGWHFSHGIEALGVLNVPSGPPVGAEHVADVLEVWRRIKPDMYRLFGNVARTYADAALARGLDPARDLNLTVAGDHPAEQYLMASSGLEALPPSAARDERDGAHLAEDLAIVEAIDCRTGRACGHGQRGNPVVTVLEKDNFSSATTSRTSSAGTRSRALRRNPPPPVLRGPHTRHRPGRRDRGPSDRRRPDPHESPKSRPRPPNTSWSALRRRPEPCTPGSSTTQALASTPKR